MRVDITHLGLPVLGLDDVVRPAAPVQLDLDVVPRLAGQLLDGLVGLALVSVQDGQRIAVVASVLSDRVLSINLRRIRAGENKVVE